MTKQSFEQRNIVARVLIRYAAEDAASDWNVSVLVALEKWIERGRERPWLSPLDRARRNV